MKKIAIGIVLLPSKEIIDKAVQINRELIKNTPENIVLDKENCVPHISLCMAVIDESDLEKLKNSLKNALNQFNTFKLKIVKLKSKINPRGQISNSFEIEHNEKLQKLHETVMREMDTFFQGDVLEEYFISPPEIKSPTTRWVGEYIETSAFDRFKPHISLGFGKFGKNIAPFSFTTSKIVVFQLGDYCTCRKKLIELNSPI